MRIVIPGGSGQVGRILARHFQATGHEVTVLSRKPVHAPWRVVEWDGATRGDWIATLEDCDVCINLTGRSVNCRYTARNRRDILQSRVRSTSLLNEVIGSLKNPPAVWLNASTATIYRHALDREMTERDGELGGGERALRTPGTFLLKLPGVGKKLSSRSKLHAHAKWRCAAQ